MIPQAIIFDLGKVIVDFDHFIFCRNISARCGLPARAVHEAVFGSGLEKRFDSGELSPEEFYDAARSALRITIEFQDFSRLWSDIFILNSGMDTLLQQLKPKYRLFCLSNTNLWHFTWCRNLFPVMQLFEHFILSYEERCCKPGSRIYEQALERIHEPPGSCLYIDDLEENVAAARLLGMRAVRFRTVAALRRHLQDTGILAIG